jgi:hypothetical protein
MVHDTTSLGEVADILRWYTRLVPSVDLCVAECMSMTTHKLVQAGCASTVMVELGLESRRDEQVCRRQVVLFQDFLSG